MTNYRFTVIVCAAMITVISVAQITLAREAKIGVDIIDSAPLASEKNGAAGVLDDMGADSIGTMRAAMRIDASPIPLQCGSELFDSDPTLSTSSTYQDSDWSMTFRRELATGSMGSLPVEQMIDLNGDGLVDYQYVNRTQSTNTYYYTSCVYLNTGSGFERVHACQAMITVDGSYTITSQSYIGDCAG